MNSKIATVTISILFCFIVVSAFVNSTALDPKNITDLRSTFLSNTSSPRTHLLLSFNEKITEKDLRDLNKNGILLDRKISENTWVASFGKKNETFANLSSYNKVRRARVLEEKDKLTTRVINGPRAWSKNIDNTHSFIVAFYDDVSLKEIKVLLQRTANVVGEIKSLNALILASDITTMKKLAAFDEVNWIDDVSPPLQPLNNYARNATGAYVLQDIPYNLSGAGVKALVYDDGTVYATHPDFGGRVIMGVGESDGISDHPTHIAGILGGSGLLSDKKLIGMAPNVTIISYSYTRNQNQSMYFFHNNTGDIEADYNKSINTYGVHLATNSLGTNVVSLGYNCSLLGDYESTSALVDSIARGSLGKKIFITWAAGNERQNTAPCGNYGVIDQAGVAKNVLTVGAIDANDFSMPWFSSWGPTDDGRLKPEIVGPGFRLATFGINSTWRYGSNYFSMWGTSMATPVVAGVIALLKQKDGSLSSSQLLSVLNRSGVPIFDSATNLSFSRVDVAAAIEFLSVHNVGENFSGFIRENQTWETKLNVTNTTFDGNSSWNVSTHVNTVVVF
ncbi:S8 family serine peptidase [Candidatus Micrarchaeota archaeon]|nr:S8 family serine peptidase [Candidatus Micrarchaeota archaeon]